MLIDCHVHLDTYSNQEVSDILDRGMSAGVEHVVSAGTTLASSGRSIELSRLFAGLLSGESLRAGQVYCFDGTYSLGARYSPHFFQPLRAL